MLLPLTPIIAALALCLVILISIILFVYLKKYRERLAMLDVQLQSASFLITELQTANNSTQQALTNITEQVQRETLENNQVSQQLELRIKKLKEQADTQEQRLCQLQDSQGQDKFYNRAFKLAEKGAGVEEIMGECELPRAEVEMLLSVYRHRSRPQ